MECNAMALVAAGTKSTGEMCVDTNAAAECDVGTMRMWRWTLRGTGMVGIVSGMKKSRTKLTG